MLEIKYHNKFKKDLKILKKRNFNMNLLKNVITMLANEQILPEKYLIFVQNRFSRSH